MIVARMLKARAAFFILYFLFGCIKMIKNVTSLVLLLVFALKFGNAQSFDQPAKVTLQNKSLVNFIKEFIEQQNGEKGVYKLDIFRNDSSLSQDTVLTHFYNARQVSELEKLIDFFDRYVMKETGMNEVAPAYEQFNKTLAKQPGVAIDIPMKQQRALYEQLEPSVWESIWKYYESTLTKVDDDDNVSFIHTEMISLNQQGTFWQYLEAYGKNDELIRAYMEINNAAGDVPPSTGRMYFMDGKDFPVDFSVASNRLIAAIHYLTFNDQIKKEESVRMNEQ